MLQKHIFSLTDSFHLLLQKLFIKKLTDLKTDLRILVGVERRNARLSGAERFAAQPFLLVLVK